MYLEVRSSFPQWWTSWFLQRHEECPGGRRSRTEQVGAEEDGSESSLTLKSRISTILFLFFFFFI